MRPNSKTEVRGRRNGDWYWIDRAVIQKYAQKIGAVGIAVYNLLASLADRNQSCFPSQKYIAECLGYSRPYINRTLKLLESNGLIKIERRSRYRCVYYLLKPRCEAGETQMSTGENPDANQEDTNHNKLTRINNHVDIEDKDSIDSNPDILKRFRPRTREELLALDLAEALNDRRGLALYLSYANKYPESLLRRVLGEVKETPEERIKKSRGALFNHLVQKYAQKASKNLSH